jgi:hypothetical protein
VLWQCCATNPRSRDHQATFHTAPSTHFVNKGHKRFSLDDQGGAVAVDGAVAGRASPTPAPYCSSPTYCSSAALAGAVAVAVAVGVAVAVVVSEVAAGTVFSTVSSTVVSTVSSTVTVRGGRVGAASSRLPPPMMRPTSSPRSTPTASVPRRRRRRAHGKLLLT